MSFINKLFGKKSSNRETKQPKISDPGETSTQENMIKVHDEYGREMLIDKNDWLDGVLIGNLETNRDNPDEPYNLIDIYLVLTMALKPIFKKLAPAYIR